LVVFCISSVFPAVAAFVHDRESWPAWWGVLDVAIAFVLATMVLAVLGIGHADLNRQAEEASYRAYRILIHGILALLVVFFLAGDHIVWGNCLTGFAWRAWLLAYCLPAWFAMFASVPPRAVATSVRGPALPTGDARTETAEPAVRVLLP
jgi:hypothetical protein